jgi:hypothetical protein
MLVSRDEEQVLGGGALWLSGRLLLLCDRTSSSSDTAMIIEPDVASGSSAESLGIVDASAYLFAEASLQEWDENGGGAKVL